MADNNSLPPVPSSSQAKPKVEDLKSRTIPRLPPLGPPPKLHHFRYDGTKFPQSAPKEPSNELERTQYILEQTLVGGKSDIALAFLRDNYVRPLEVLPCHSANTTRSSNVCSRLGTSSRVPRSSRPSGGSSTKRKPTRWRTSCWATAGRSGARALHHLRRPKLPWAIRTVLRAVVLEGG